VGVAVAVFVKADKSKDCTDELENPPEFNRLMTLALIATDPHP
jgi:hypothetical protein